MSLSLRDRVEAYYEFTKPKIWYLLVFTSLTGTFVAARLLGTEVSPLRWVVIGAAITMGCAGCNALTSYHDRDIDAVMLRTRHRPLPSRRIRPGSALLFGLVLTGTSLALSAFLNLLSLTWMALGVFDNVVVYSLLLKRRSPLNILLGGFSGGLPVLFGWSAAIPGLVGSVALLPVLMASLVFLWIPIHIWFLAVSYRSDYSAAGVPMLPVVIGTGPALRLITLLSLIFLPFSLAIYLVGAPHLGLAYALAAVVGGVANLVGSIYVLLNPTETNAWRMFKISSPYLFLLFLGMIIDVAIRG
jgi:protoheme IX farnesyltransferase